MPKKSVWSNGLRLFQAGTGNGNNWPPAPIATARQRSGSGLIAVTEILKNLSFRVSGSAVVFAVNR
jgi:hypothetical protein